MILSKTIMLLIILSYSDQWGSLEMEQNDPIKVIDDREEAWFSGYDAFFGRSRDISNEQASVLMALMLAFENDSTSFTMFDQKSRTDKLFNYSIMSHKVSSSLSLLYKKLSIVKNLHILPNIVGCLKNDIDKLYKISNIFTIHNKIQRFFMTIKNNLLIKCVKLYGDALGIIRSLISVENEHVLHDIRNNFYKNIESTKVNYPNGDGLNARELLIWSTIKYLENLNSDIWNNEEAFNVMKPNEYYDNFLDLFRSEIGDISWVSCELPKKVFRDFRKIREYFKLIINIEEPLLRAKRRAIESIEYDVQTDCLFSSIEMLINQDYMINNIALFWLNYFSDETSL